MGATVSVESSDTGESVTCEANVERSQSWWTNRVQPCELTEGDHIYRIGKLYSLPSPFHTHHGIVVHVPPGSNPELLTSVRVVHFIGDNPSDACVTEDTLESFLHGFSLRRAQYSSDRVFTLRPEGFHSSPSLPAELVVLRARALVGYANFEVLNGNCEHIARYCKCGVWGSDQADRLNITIQPHKLLKVTSKRIKDDLGHTMAVEAALFPYGRPVPDEIEERIGAAIAQWADSEQVTDAVASSDVLVTA
eukprot:TRINITY_DN33961_c0_g1_i1.p1 TRINITY_DN33961_c0_g1~~TRINITY_DN33961_c0_g1_i1.p1  ORF type:complete len:259 (+),score=25.75 TRINITY_DN33961_c0_g1_i1:28-777(+)